MYAAALGEIRNERSQGGQQAEIVEQRRAQIVGDIANAAHAFVDELEGAVETARLFFRDALAHHAELHLHRGKDLRRFIVQFERKPAALLFVMLHHAA